jgi:hypothetical protein
MGVICKLTDEGMDWIRASEVFRELPPEKAGELEEFLYTAFSGEVEVSAEEAEARLDRYLEGAPEGARRVREIILETIRSA